MRTVSMKEKELLLEPEEKSVSILQHVFEAALLQKEFVPIRNLWIPIESF